MAAFERVIVIVLDGVGVGELPDAASYHDTGSNTLRNLAQQTGGLHLEKLRSLGLGNLTRMTGVPPEKYPMGAYGKMMEKSKGKDSISGHWELFGIVLDRPFPTYPDGFPEEIIQEFERMTGRKTIGNYPASGTEIIARLGEKHMETGDLIVYTSADSVFQVAAHEDIVPPEILNEYCSKAREMLTGKHAVGRVISRPFVGKPGDFERTVRRRDFSIQPPEDTVLDLLLAGGHSVVGIGKVDDLFGGRGFTKCRHLGENEAIMSALDDEMNSLDAGLILSNLIDFDTKWGHRNDIEGFKRGLERFDLWLANAAEKARDSDAIMITADHGCDPTTSSTDHSREHVPLLVFGDRVRSGVSLGVRESFSDLGATISDVFGISGTGNGKSFLRDISDAN
jgi:phosphopentomutase